MTPVRVWQPDRKRVLGHGFLAPEGDGTMARLSIKDVPFQDATASARSAGFRVELETMERTAWDEPVPQQIPGGLLWPVVVLTIAFWCALVYAAIDHTGPLGAAGATGLGLLYLTWRWRRG